MNVDPRIPDCDMALEDLSKNNVTKPQECVGKTALPRGIKLAAANELLAAAA